MKQEISLPVISLFAELYPAMRYPDSVRLVGDEYDVFLQDPTNYQGRLPFDKEQWDTFIDTLLGLGVARWKRVYENLAVLDGLSWQIQVRDPRLTVRSRGQNAFPGSSGELLSYDDPDAEAQLDLVWDAVVKLVSTQ